MLWLAPIAKDKNDGKTECYDAFLNCGSEKQCIMTAWASSGGSVNQISTLRRRQDRRVRSLLKA